MNTNLFSSKSSDFTNWINKSWAFGEAKKIIHFTVPLKTVKQYLDAAFSETIKEPGNFFLSSYSYEATIRDNTIQLKLLTRGRYRITFEMTGYLFEEGTGSKLEMSVKHSSTTFKFYGFFLIFALMFNLIAQVSLLTLLFQFPLFIGFLILNLKWHLAIALDKIESLLYKLVEKSE